MSNHIVDDIEEQEGTSNDAHNESMVIVPPVAIPLGNIQRCMQDDPNELLKTRYLCRGGGLLLVGPTGIGKSSLSMQCMLSWAMGRKALGIEPTRKLRS